ncbi:hypothetical protein JB92DRAFT_2729663, partial [Gautieria morchelliformis]
HHHKWYISDGSAIFQVENKLYKVHAALLANVSVMLQEMFAMPSGTEHSCEGTRDDRPIVLHPPVTSQKLDYLLEWFYSQYSEKEPSDFSIKALDAILELAAFLQIEAARTFALKELNARAVSPAWRLLLGQRHHIPGWIPAAFRTLIDQIDEFVTLDEYQELGMLNVHVLHQTLTRIQSHRLAVAYNPPVVQHHLSCINHWECRKAWGTAWWGGFARHYLHPESPSPPAVVLRKLEVAAIPKVNRECQRLTVESVAEDGVLMREEVMILEGVAKLEPVEKY